MIDLPFCHRLLHEHGELYNLGCQSSRLVPIRTRVQRHNPGFRYQYVSQYQHTMPYAWRLTCSILILASSISQGFENRMVRPTASFVGSDREGRSRSPMSTFPARRYLFTMSPPLLVQSLLPPALESPLIRLRPSALADEIPRLQFLP